MRLGDYQREISQIESGETVATAEGLSTALLVLAGDLRRALWNPDYRGEAAELAERAEALYPAIADRAAEVHHTAEARTVATYAAHVARIRRAVLSR